MFGGFDGFGDNRSQGGFGGTSSSSQDRGDDRGGPRGGRGGGRSGAGMSTARSSTGQFSGGGRADGSDKDDFGKAVTPTSQQHGMGLSPGQATAIFGNQLGPALAGRKGFTATDASQLAGRMNIGQLSGVPSVMAAIANEFGKMIARNMVEELAFNPNAKAVRDQFGNITGVSTDERGLIWGRAPSEFVDDDRGDGPKTATFTPSPSTPTASTAVDSGSNASLIPSSKSRGTPDSSGSGRRSMFGQVVK